MTACLGGTEEFIRGHKLENGRIVATIATFLCGRTKRLTNEQVCAGKTGHVEVREVT